MKKIFLVFISLFLVIVLCACTNETSSLSTSSSSATTTTGIMDTVKVIALSDKAYIYGAPNTIAIMQDVDIYTQSEYWGEEWINDSDKMYFECIKGETESHQLMMTAKSDIKSFMFSAGDLVSEDSSYTISSDLIEVYAERYIEVKAPSSTSKKACHFSGFYPDALVPIYQYKLRKENKIDKGMNQGIWISINVPRDAKAGNYSGVGTLTLDGVKISIPLTLKVYNVVIPEEIHKKTAFDIWNSQIGYGETIQDREDGSTIDWSQIYYDYLISQRITPQQLLQTSVNAAYAEEAVKAAQNPRVTNYRLPYKQETIDSIEGSVVQYQSVVDMLTILANKNIELREAGDTTTDLFKKAFYYFASIIDEPTGSKYINVRYCDKCVTDAKAEVMPLLSAYPDLQESLQNIPHVVTTTLNPNLYATVSQGGVQTWCCQDGNYTKEMIDAIEGRKNDTSVYPQGENFWVYSTCDSNDPYPSMQLDDNMMSMRVLSWEAFDYGIDCQLFWCVCYYQKTKNKTTSSRDIWSDPLSWDKANGDGYLLYPGSRYGLETPISTLRLQNIKEGSEDYEYLYMIKEQIELINKEEHTSFDAMEFINKYTSVLYNNGSFVAKTNVKNFEIQRKAVLEVLEILMNDRAAALELLNK